MQAGLAAWQAYAAEGHVTLRVELADRPAAAAVAGALEQIVDNYFANALAAAPPGSVVTLHASQSRDRVRVAMIDAGPGMAPEQRRRAFDRF